MVCLVNVHLGIKSELIKSELISKSPKTVAHYPRPASSNNLKMASSSKI